MSKVSKLSAPAPGNSIENRLEAFNAIDYLDIDDSPQGVDFWEYVLDTLEGVKTPFLYRLKAALSVLRGKTFEPVE